MHGRFGRSGTMERTKAEDRFTLRQWFGRISARRVGFFLCVLGYTWALALFGLTMNRDDGSLLQTEKYQGEPKDPVKEQETQEKRTMDLMTSLLEQMNHMVEDINKTNHHLLSKIQHLETDLDINRRNVEVNKELAAKLDKQQVLIERISKSVHGNQPQPQRPPAKPPGPDCEISSKESKEYTDCKEKMAFLQRSWSNNDCYKQHGVDGSRCSVRKFLSEVESFCPLMNGRDKRSFQFEVKKLTDEERPWTNTEYSYAELIGILTKNGPKKKYDWMQKRIENIWGQWSRAIRTLQLPRRRRKKVLLYLGLLTNMPGAKFSSGIHRGGPLGELVQWSDIITALYLLGHELTVISDVSDMLSYLSDTQLMYLPCKEPQKERFYLDLIYTDIFGFKQVEERMEQKAFEANRCVFRLVDSFGTEPMFNWKPYAQSQGVDRFWGSCNVNPKQFFTLFPHSPDNSFMGFVIKESEFPTSNHTIKKNQALVYGKKPDYWDGHTSYINVVHSMGVEIHGTVFTGKTNGQHAKVPQYVHNHGLLFTSEVRRILRESKIFLGMGFPYEGPAPLEALAEGCVFFNAKLDPPHSGLNTKFFKPKPTMRQLTSQVPYMESIGPPHVFTININDVQQVKNAVDAALQAVDAGKVKPLIPREFTEIGMLERLNAYIEHQDFCSTSPLVWPPLSDGQVLVGKQGVSCVHTCVQKDLVCEPAHFPSINNMDAIKKYFHGNCSSTGSATNHLYPARQSDSNTCYMQNEKMIFSCAGEHQNLQRLCPCRTYIKHQSALCQSCL